MKTPRLWSSVFLLTLAATVVAPGQSPSASQRSRSEPPAFDRPVLQPTSTITDKSGGLTTDDVKLGVDLVVMDALVLQQKTGRAVGGLDKSNFSLFEDGVRQEITHFSQDTLPLSVLILIDRGGCLDPFSDKVRHATMEALNRLRPQDEVALMAFADTTDLMVRFGRNKDAILNGLDHLPPHDEAANHCFNRAFSDAAEYMGRAGNPIGRRVIIVITGITSSLDCSGPTSDETRAAILESGSVVCGIIPKTPGQRMESGLMRSVTGVAGMFKVHTSNLNQFAEETGGEVLTDKPEFLNHTFNDLMDHLRTRYSIGFVSTNKLHDGKYRKLKVELASQPNAADGKLVVKTRRGYLGPKDATGSRPANTK
jgi:Ca-activated chloride channel homolog